MNSPENDRSAPARRIGYDRELGLCSPKAYPHSHREINAALSCHWSECKICAVLTLGRGKSWFYVENAENGPAVLFLIRDRPRSRPLRIAKYATRRRAQVVAERIANAPLNVDNLATLDAPWRRNNASSDQIQRMARDGLTPWSGMSSGEACDQIAMSRCLDVMQTYYDEKRS